MSGGLDKLLDKVNWTPVEQPPGMTGLYATHEGVLAIGWVRLKCYTLNDGQRVFDADDFADAFDLKATPSPRGGGA